MNEHTEQASFDNLYRQIFQLLKPRLVWLFWLCILGIGLAVCSGIYGFMAGPVVKFAVSNEPLVLPLRWRFFQQHADWISNNFLVFFPTVVVGASVLKGVFSYTFNVLRCRLGHLVSRHLRALLFRRIEASQSDELEVLGKANVLSRFIHDISTIERFVSDGLIRSSQSVAEICVLFVLCVGLDWQLSVLFFFVYPLVVLPLLRLTKRLKIEAHRTQNALGHSASIFQDQMHITKMIQSLGYPSVLRRRLSRSMDELYSASLEVVRLKAFASPIAEIMGAAALCITVGVCGWRMTQGGGDGAASISFIACLLLMYKPVKGLGELPQLLGPGRAALQRLGALESLGVENRGSEYPWDEDKLIQLRNVTVRRGNSLLFKPIDFEVNRGDRILIRGPNGAGKSSLVELLLGLRRPEQGDLLLGGVAHNAIALSEWRKWVGWVPQQQLLIEGSLLENIIMGREGFELTDVVECWRQLGFEAPSNQVEFWQQRLKPEGHGLSGGQLRKLLLARAFLSQPRILILDEPEAFQDAVGRDALRRALSTLSSNRTLVVVSHEMIPVLEPTQIIELEPKGGTQ